MRTDQLFADEAAEAKFHVGAQALVGERAHRQPMEHLALDRTALEHLPLVGVEAFEPRDQQRLDRRRHRNRPALARQRDHLLQEQRIALAGRDHARGGVGVEPAAELLEQQLAVVGIERLEQHGGRVELAPAPRRPVLEQLRASRTDTSIGTPRDRSTT